MQKKGKEGEEKQPKLIKNKSIPIVFNKNLNESN